MKKLKSKLGFTIAELVIAIVLVAGIAMILMPSLVADNERQVFATSLKKIYTDLQQTNQAVGLLMARGQITSGTSAIETLKKAAIKSMKLTAPKTYAGYLKGYDIDGATPATEFKYYEDDETRNNILILKNGVFLQFTDDYLLIDVNGRKQPNETGRDVYYLSVNQNAEDNSLIIAPFDYNDTYKCPEKNKKLGCADAKECKGCAKRVLEETGRIDWY